MLKLIKDLGTKLPTPTSKRTRRYGLYECQSCHLPFETRVDAVNAGTVKNCPNCKNKTHGLSNHRLYETWVGERKRCYSTTNREYLTYGARGIKMSKEFHDFPTWLAYVESLDNAYKPTYTIDRIDNDGNYERGNLRWADKTTQAQNTTNLACNNTSGYRGVTSVGNKWRARLEANGTKTHLGYFDSKNEAAVAVNTYITENSLHHVLNTIKDTE